MKLINEVFIGSLTGKSEIEQRNMIESFKEKNRHDKIKVSIAPDLVSKELIKMLKEYNIMAVELEVQSTNSYILKKCGFDYTYEDIKKASKRIKWNRIKLSFQVRNWTSRKQ